MSWWRRFDLIEAIKTTLIWICGTIEFAVLLALLLGVPLMILSTR